MSPEFVRVLQPAPRAHAVCNHARLVQGEPLLKITRIMNARRAPGNFCNGLQTRLKHDLQVPLAADELRPQRGLDAAYPSSFDLNNGSTVN